LLLLLLLKHLLSLHQLTLLLLLHLIFLKFLKIYGSLFRVHASEHLFLLFGEVELDSVPLKLNLLSSRTPACSWIGQQEVSLSQVLLLLRWRHLREGLPLLHADALNVLLDDLLLSLHMRSHGTGRNLTNQSGLLHHSLLLWLLPLLPLLLTLLLDSRPDKLLLLLPLLPLLLLLLALTLLLLKLQLLFVLLQNCRMGLGLAWPHHLTRLHALLSSWHTLTRLETLLTRLCYLLPTLRHLLPRLGHLLPRLCHLLPRLCHLLPRLRHLLPGL